MRLITEHAQDLIYRYEYFPQRGFTYVSPSFTRITGYTPEEYYADPDLDLKIVHPDDRPLFEQYVLGNKIFEKPFCVRWVRKDGKIIWTEQINVPIYDDQGNLIALQGIAREITERKEMEEALKKSEARFRMMAENAQDLIYRYEFAPQRGFTYVSPSATRITGYTPEEHYADPDLGFKLIHPDDRPLLEQYFQGSGTFEKPLTLRWVHKNGQVIWTEQINTPVYDEQGNLIAIDGIARDVTERKQRERLLEAQAQVAQALGERLELRPLLERLLEAARHAIPAANKGSILLSEPDGGLRIYALSGYRDPRIYDLTFVRDMGYAALAARQRRALLIPNVRDYSTTRYNGEIEEVRSVQSAIAAPLIAQDRLIGVITLDNTLHKSAFSEADMHTLVNFASTAALAIETSRLNAETQQRLKELNAITQVSTALRAAQTRAEMPAIIVEQVGNLFHAGGVALEKFDPVRGEMLVELGAGIWSSLTGERIPPGGGISYEVLQSGQPYLNNDVTTDPRLYRPDLIGDCRAIAGLPLKSEEKTVGQLWVARRKAWSEADIQLLKAIAEISANAMTRAELHEETHRQLNQLRAIQAIDYAILNSLDLKLALNMIVRQVASQLQADAAAILLLHADRLTLEFAAGEGFRTPLVNQSRIRLGQGHAGRAAAEHRIFSVPDMQLQGDFVRSEMIQKEGFLAHHVAPLIAKGEVKGVLEVFHRQRFEPEPQWLELLEAFANQSAIAIDNAGMYEKLHNALLEIRLAYEDTIEGWSRAMDLRDRETEGHAQRVTEMTLQLARAMGLPEEQLVHFRRGALLHDIGKLGVPDEILFKPEPLNEQEWKIMRQHPQYAYEMLLPISYLHPALEIPYCHHEKWDGTGYPRGLKGEEIPLSARIFAIADVYEALTSDRPYRRRWSKEEALEYIRQQSGKHFDPKVVEVFLRLIEEGLL